LIYINIHVQVSDVANLLNTLDFRRDFRAADSHLDSDVGDMVLISQLVKPQGHLITHKVKEVIFKHGAVIDPITGRLCHGTNYAEDTVNSNFQKHVEKQAESEV